MHAGDPKEAFDIPGKRPHYAVNVYAMIPESAPPRDELVARFYGYSPEAAQERAAQFVSTTGNVWPWVGQ